MELFVNLGIEELLLGNGNQFGGEIVGQEGGFSDEGIELRGQGRESWEGDPYKLSRVKEIYLSLSLVYPYLVAGSAFPASSGSLIGLGLSEGLFSTFYLLHSQQLYMISYNLSNGQSYNIQFHLILYCIVPMYNRNKIMIVKWAIALFFLVACTCLIEQQTFKQFFHATFDMDRDGEFDISDWIAYFKFIEPEISVNSSHLFETFNIYDTDRDSKITLGEMMEFAQPVVTGTTGPKQIHLGFTNVDGEMQVMWITSPDKHKHPCVKYGLDAKKLDMTANATYTTYNAGKLGFHGRIYKAVMTQLQPLKKYYYKVGDSRVFTYSQIRSFVSQPNKGTKLQRINFGVFGDMGTYAPMGHFVSKALERFNKKDPLDFVFLNGDIAYAGMNSEKVGEVEPIWDLFGQQTEPWASIVPFMPGVGNHEKYYNYTAYQNRYYLPRSPGSNSNLWFSFDYGQIHLVHFSSEHDYHKGSDQYKFLEADLKAARSNGYTEWIIVAAHRPFYSSDSDGYHDTRDLAIHLQDLMNEYKVDIVQTGHEHCYERTWPVHKNVPLFTGSNTTHFVNPEAPIYVVQGTAGALIVQSYINPSPPWSLRRESKYGFGRIEIKGSKLKYQFISVGGEVIDEWYILK